MTPIGPLLLLLAAGTPLQTPQEPQHGCAVCHGEEATELGRSVHVMAGATCVTCHGGVDGTNDQERAHEGMHALDDARAVVESCASCHADPARMRGWGLSTEQLALYWTSAHGRALAENDAQDVATCVDCHDSHHVLSPKDPRSGVHRLSQVATCGRCHADPSRMEPYGLDAGVVETYRHSAHGVALLDEGVLSSPACTDCHGSHGALPPRLDELGRVCGGCHAVVRESFDESPHAAAVREGLLEECVSCHGDHGVRHPDPAMLVGDGPGHCGRCHKGDDDPGATVGRRLFGDLSELDDGISQAEERLREAATHGLFLSVEKDYLRDARQLRGIARVRTHTLSEQRLDDILNRGRAMIAETYESVDIRERALRDHKIFTGIFLGVALLLAAVLLTYRRETLGRPSRPGGSKGAQGP